MEELIVVGGGLAGTEAAWQAARRGVKVVLYEMRPVKSTEAHKTGLLGELVCSNSLRSAEMTTAPGLLKKELQMAGSLIMEAAESCRIAAGGALAVDRKLFSEYLTNAISAHASIEVIREEIGNLPHGISIIATGPLTSEKMTETLGQVIGREYLYFYDAIAPIVDADTIDYGTVYLASRYGKGGKDYINCPMTKSEYTAFLDAVLEADKANIREFENKKVFEGCMPVEVMALRGQDTLRFGPMKPVGLPDPKTGKLPYAVVQLRAENKEGSAFNMVGFQTRLKWPEQKRVFRMIPGLERAEFLRFGSIHRNTFMNSPVFLEKDLSLKCRPATYLAGQITGVEGYIESTAMGLIAGINAARKILGNETVEVPPASAHGSLIGHITILSAHFQPSNINFGLMPSVDNVRSKEQKRMMIVDRALADWKEYCAKVGA